MRQRVALLLVRARLGTPTRHAAQGLLPVWLLVLVLLFRSRLGLEPVNPQYVCAR